MKISTIGSGYVGLVTGVCLAHLGHDVIGLDIDEQKIQKLNQNKVPLYEPGLEKLLINAAATKKISFTTSYREALSSCDVCILAVPTPSKACGAANLDYLKSALDSIAKHSNSYKLLVVKSTVPPGSTNFVKTYLKDAIDKLGKNFKFDVVSNPEFLREGSAVEDFLYPDRLIIGVDNQTSLEQMRSLYEPLHLESHQFVVMDIVSSEMTKYAANSMLATRISFMNELSGLCEALGANIEHVKSGIGSDSRIGNKFLNAGVGFGGSCFPKDIRALQAIANKLNYKMPILSAVESINLEQKKLLTRKLVDYFGGADSIKNKTIAIWGVSFKPETDDIREAPSLELIRALKELGTKLKICDPVALNNAKSFFQDHDNISFCDDQYSASEDADAIALVTEWDQYKSTDLLRILKTMKGKALFDGRNVFFNKHLNKSGFEYFAIGMPSEGCYD